MRARHPGFADGSPLTEGQNETLSLAVPAGDSDASHSEGSVDKSSPQLGYIVARVGAVFTV